MLAHCLLDFQEKISPLQQHTLFLPFPFGHALVKRENAWLFLKTQFPYLISSLSFFSQADLMDAKCQCLKSENMSDSEPNPQITP